MLNTVGMLDTGASVGLNPPAHRFSRARTDIRIWQRKDGTWVWNCTAPHPAHNVAFIWNGEAMPEFFGALISDREAAFDAAHHHIERHHSS